MMRRLLVCPPFVTRRVMSGPVVRMASTQAVLDLNKMQSETLRVLQKDSVYTQGVLEQEAAYYFKTLKMHSSYFRTYNTPEILAKHLVTFIASKRMSMITSDQATSHLYFKVKQENGTVYFCANTPELQSQVEHEIQAEIAKTDLPGYGYSVRTFVSQGPATTQGPERLVVYDLLWSKYRTAPKGATGTEQKINVKDLCTEEFLNTKLPEAVERYRTLLEMAEQSKLIPGVIKTFSHEEPGITVVMLAQFNSKSSSMEDITRQATSLKLDITRKYVEKFSNGCEVCSLFVKNLDPNAYQDFVSNMLTMALLPSDVSKTLTEAFYKNSINSMEMMYIHAVSTFAYYFTSGENEDYLSLKRFFEKDKVNLARLRGMCQRLWKEAVSLEKIVALASTHVDVMKALYADFQDKSTGKDKSKKVHNNVVAMIKSQISDPTETRLFTSFMLFNESVLKTNFFKQEKAALSFRIDPTFMKDLDFPRVPYGFFMFVGKQFTGFHIRFSDIARGGVRLIRSPDLVLYEKNFERLFSGENYGLAETQHKKNKDIPEGGSKGTILLKVGVTEESFEPVFMKYVDALLDVILPNQPNVLDRFGVPEIIFLGPDENTAGEFPDRAMLHSRTRGYAFYKSFTTGKNPRYGGVPHDEYGMTTASVAEFKRGIRDKLKLDETKMTKVQTGGPDGDLGSNEILMSSDKCIAIVDGSGLVYDPEGLNKPELVRLVKERNAGRPKQSTIDNFDKSRLSKAGFKVLVSDMNVKLPDGTIVENGRTFRDTFHFYPTADIFVPCGGRPSAVTLQNVNQMLIDSTDITGDMMNSGKVSVPASNLRYKYIVEGANLFITEDARIALENVGVILFKDASANKGGVTSSSLEVLAGLALTDEEHSKLMCVLPGKEAPDFYKQYVKQIITIIRTNASKEFEALWKEYKLRNGKTPRCLLTNELSLAITDLKAQIIDSGLFTTNKELVRKVLAQALPKLLLEQVGLDAILRRVPQNYLAAIFSTYLASDFVYTTGLETNECSFSAYMQKFGA